MHDDATNMHTSSQPDSESFNFIDPPAAAPATAAPASTSIADIAVGQEVHVTAVIMAPMCLPFGTELLQVMRLLRSVWPHWHCYENVPDSVSV